MCYRLLFTHYFNTDSSGARSVEFKKEDVLPSSSNEFAVSNWKDSCWSNEGRCKVSIRIVIYHVMQPICSLWKVLLDLLNDVFCKARFIFIYDYSCGGVNSMYYAESTSHSAFLHNLLDLTGYIDEFRSASRRYTDIFKEEFHFITLLCLLSANIRKAWVLSTFLF